MSGTPAYFTSLALENVRCFGSIQKIELANRHQSPTQWNIILGENGTGKTTILQSIILASPVEAKPRPGALAGLVPRALQGYFGHGLKLWSRFARVDSNIHSEDMESYKSMTIKIQFTNSSHLNDTTTPEKIYDSYFNQQRPGQSSSIAGTQATDPVITPPLCFAYGASRRMTETSLNENDFGEGYESLFSAFTELQSPSEWLLRADYRERRDPNGRHQSFDKIKTLLIQLLPDLDAIEIDIDNQLGTPRVRYKTCYGWVSMHQLSVGYQTMAAWMVDLASRMYAAYPNSSDPLKEPAVVLVDEFDLHMHPRWQRNSILLLTESFPNVQFIVTAHSPLVVQAAPNANLILLRREEGEIVVENDLDEIRNWRIDQILTSDLFGLATARPPELENIFRERRNLLKKQELSIYDRNRLKELEEEIGELSGPEAQEDIAAMNAIAEFASLIRQHRREESND